MRERERLRDEERAFDAVAMADAVLAGSFRDTLGSVVDNMSWTGHPPIDEQQLAPSAITYLGSTDGQRGWWLHYTNHESDHSEDDDLVHVVTVIAPCSCGTYITVELVDEEHLIFMLDELTTEPGAPVECNYRLRIRTTSYADPAHTNFEPPF